MKDICIDFAEWMSDNTFNGKFIIHNVSSNGIHSWKLNNELNYLKSNELYQKYCNEKNIEFTLEQQLMFFVGNFEPTNFIEFIIDNNFFYYRYSYNNFAQKPFWTTNTGKGKYNTDELYILFNT